MERGPLALFGAIVAVGLGPALWLGAQFGNVAVPPEAPPAAVISEQRPDAGGGAGAAPDEPSDRVTTTRQADLRPVTNRPAPRPSTAPTTTAPEPEKDPATTPPASSKPAEPDDDSTTPPAENTDDPSVPPAGGDDGEDPGDVVPPETDSGPVLVEN